jgi:hypothetical protein
MTTRHDFHKAVIGRSELLKFVDADIINVPAKTDTGAYQSSVHASDIKLEEDGTLSFVLLGGHPMCGAMASKFSVDKFKIVQISNSFGHKENRYEVNLKVKVGPKVFKAKFTLADRTRKTYPVLLGRELMNHRFLVDPSENNINRELLKRDYEINFPLVEEDL